MIAQKFPPKNSQKNKVDSGLACLISVASLHGVRIDADQLRHKLAIGERNFTEIELIRAARDYKFKARFVQIKPKNLHKMPTPFIAKQNNGEFVVVLSVKKATKEILLISPFAATPKKMPIETFTKNWCGELLLIAQRFWKEVDRKFGIKWFLPTIIKYKKSLTEVLIATLFLQILGLMAPFITQVVIDKALSHNSLATLDIMMFGLIIVAVFEMLMSIVKNYILLILPARLMLF